MAQFEFHSLQEHTEMVKGEKRTQVKAVDVTNDEGTVSIKYLSSNGIVLAEHVEILNAQQIRRIQEKRFVPDLFDRCLVNCGVAAQEQTPRNAAKLRRMAGGAYALQTRRRGRRNN